MPLAKNAQAIATAVGFAADAFGFAQVIPGLEFLDPLQTSLDEQSKKLDEINGKLDDLANQVETLGQDILAELKIVQNKIDEQGITDALAKVYDARDKLDDFRKAEAPSKALAQQTIDTVESALNSVIQQIKSSSGTDADITMALVGAITLAVATRLQVVYEVEKGALGQSSILRNLDVSAQGLETMSEALYAQIFDNMVVSEKTEFLPGPFLPGYRVTITVEDPLTGSSLSEAIEGLPTDLLTMLDDVADLAEELQGRLADEAFAEMNFDKLAEMAANFRELSDGEDVLGTNGNDALAGTGGNDLITGKAGDDEMSGGGEADVLYGGSGKDSLGGGAGRDYLEGGRGQDNLSGNANADTLLGGAGSDTLGGGTGNDQLLGGANNDVLRGQKGKDAADGGDGADQIFGGQGMDTLSGGAGRDLVDGQAQDDELFGNGGRDSLIGGAGDDTMTGGRGADTFLFGQTASNDDGDDVITDFDLTADSLVFDGAREGSISVSAVTGGTRVNHDDGTVFLEGTFATLDEINFSLG